ncbi:MAG: hypothetical protein AAF682_12445 [Planctomycetota bacterium]
MKSHRGVMILVFGILGILLCQIFAILAWVMGNNDLKEIDAGRMDPEGRSLTQIGKILGIISIALTVVGILFAVVMVVLGVGFGAAAQ